MIHPKSTPPSPRLILVVEDEAIVARDIAVQLRDLGHEPIGPAVTGEQAIAMAGEWRPHLILMDIHLVGVMDGITAAQIIRTKFNVPTIFLSAFSGDGIVVRINAAQPAGYLAKPFTEHELQVAVETAFQSIHRAPTVHLPAREG